MMYPPFTKVRYEESARGLSQQASAGPFTRPELGGRADSDVRSGDCLPARISGIHGWTNHDRSRTLHRDGHRLERTGARRYGICRWPGGLQFSLPGVFLLALRLGFHYGSPRQARPSECRRQCVDRGDCEECFHLPGNSVSRRISDSYRIGSCQRAAIGTTGTSFPASAR